MRYFINLQFLFIIFFSFFLLTGCAEVAIGPANDPNIAKVIQKSLLSADEELLFWSEAVWLPNEFGYGQIGPEMGSHYFGILVLSDKKVCFAAWDLEDEKYVSMFNIQYNGIKHVKLSAYGNGRRLAILSKADNWNAFDLLAGKWSGLPSHVKPEKVRDLMIERIPKN